LHHHSTISLLAAFTLSSLISSKLAFSNAANSNQIGLIASSFNDLPAHRIYIVVAYFIQIGIFQRTNSIQIGLIASSFNELPAHRIYIVVAYISSKLAFFNAPIPSKLV
jgi:hypothetical protein